MMTDKTVLILHRKSANEPAVKEALKRGAMRIIAGGGDGTINAVTNALVGKGKSRPDVTLGICPLGTANDFARGCGLPTDDLTECLRIACTKKGRKIDVGVLNGRSFVNVASAGFGAEITATTPVEIPPAIHVGGDSECSPSAPPSGTVVHTGRDTSESAGCR